MTTASRIERQEVGSAAQPAPRRLAKVVSRAWKYRELYLLLLPTILFFVVFSLATYHFED